MTIELFEQWIKQDLRGQLAHQEDFKVWADNKLNIALSTILQQSEHGSWAYTLSNLMFIDEFGLDAFQFNIKDERLDIEVYARVIKGGLNRYALYAGYIEGNIRFEAYIELMTALGYMARLLQNSAGWSERPLHVDVAQKYSQTAGDV